MKSFHHTVLNSVFLEHLRSVRRLYKEMHSLSLSPCASIPFLFRLILGLSEPELTSQSTVIKLPTSKHENVNLKKTLQEEKR
jgi:hypothetical protein